MRKNGWIYVTAACAAFAVKCFYNTADSDALAWILTPVSWWVQILSGISFEYVPHVGYVSRAYRFIIAPSCSGVRFLLLVFLMLVFSFTHRIDTRGRKALWSAFCAGFSYIATVLVNGIRITVSIYLPLFLAEHNRMAGWLTAQRLHTMIGTAVYFSFVFVLYFQAERICMRFFAAPSCEQSVRHGKRIGIPIVWYAATVLVLPFLGRLYHREWTGFGQYALLVTGICAVIVLFFALITRRAKV